MVSKQLSCDPSDSAVPHKPQTPFDKECNTPSAGSPQDTSTSSRLSASLPSSPTTTQRKSLSEALCTRSPATTCTHYRAEEMPSRKMIDRSSGHQGLQNPFSRQLEEIEKRFEELQILRRQQSHPEHLFSAVQKAEKKGTNLQVNNDSKQERASKDTTSSPQGSQKAFSRQFEEIEKTERRQHTVPQKSCSLLVSKPFEDLLHRMMHGEPCDLKECHFARDYNIVWGPGSQKPVRPELAQSMRASWATHRVLLLLRVRQDRQPAYPQTRGELQSIIEFLDINFQA